MGPVDSSVGSLDVRCSGGVVTGLHRIVVDVGVDLVGGLPVHPLGVLVVAGSDDVVEVDLQGLRRHARARLEAAPVHVAAVGLPGAELAPAGEWSGPHRSGDSRWAAACAATRPWLVGRRERSGWTRVCGVSRRHTADDEHGASYEADDRDHAPAHSDHSEPPCYEAIR